MRRSRYIQQILAILAKNVDFNGDHDLMETVIIADTLNISVSETQQLLVTMNEMGIVTCDIDVDHSLITRDGFSKLHATVH
jgi:DNA-binding IclR family transcriptional regulator